MEIFNALKEEYVGFSPKTIITGFQVEVQKAVEIVFGAEHYELNGTFYQYILVSYISSSFIFLRCFTIFMTYPSFYIFSFSFQLLKKEFVKQDLILFFLAKIEPISTIISNCFFLPLLPEEKALNALEIIRQQTHTFCEEETKDKVSIF